MKQGSRKSIFAAPVFAVICFQLTIWAADNQSALEPAGLQGVRFEGLWWTFFYVSAAVYVIVMAVLAAAFFKRRRATEITLPELSPEPVTERRTDLVVKAAVGVTLVAMFTLMISSFKVGTAINTLQAAENPLVIKVTGSQFWWDMQYRDDIASNYIRTANELHLPVGRPVKLELRSTDVIHSFWLPNMNGKKDLVPNYPTTFYFRPDKVGIITGQYAEFCGYQHAKMRFNVIVESPEEFDAWVRAQRQTPAGPSDPVTVRGQEVFMTTTCIQCHAIAGTKAGASFGPDLSHVASRSYIGAGSLTNTDENLRNWITDPHKIKPGNRMPMNTLSDEDLNALVAYLRTLK